MFRTLALLALTVLTLLSPGSATAQQVLRVGIGDEPYPPFSSRDASGTWRGFEIELLQALCTEMKVKCELVPAPFDGMIPALNARTFDVIIASLSITPKRREVIAFSDKYYAAPPMLVAPAALKVTLCKDTGVCADSIAGKTIGVQKASTHEAFARAKYGKAVQIKTYDKQDNVNADLLAGRIDLTIANSVIMETFLATDAAKAAGLERKAVPVRDAEIYGPGVGAGFRKEDTALVLRFNDAIKAVRASGAYKALNDKYFKFDIYGD